MGLGGRRPNPFSLAAPAPTLGLFPSDKKFCYSNFHPRSPTAHSLHPFFCTRTALVFKLCMVGEFQAA